MFREFDIEGLFDKAFGYKPKPYVSDQLTVLKQAYSSAQGLSPYYDIYKDINIGGTPSQGRDIFLPVWLDDFMLPFAVVDITGRNNIVETVMVNRSGTVKERISTEDYKINIKGIIIREDGQYPELEINTLKIIQEGNRAVDIRNTMTDIFLLNVGDHPSKVVINDLKFPGSVGVMNAKAYEISLTSDRVFELYVQS